MPQIIAANRALDGVRVFLAANGRWAELPGEAMLLNLEDVQAALMLARRDAERLLVVEPYLTAMRVDGGGFAPVHLRRLEGARSAAAE